MEPEDRQLSRDWAIRPMGGSAYIAAGFFSCGLLNVDAWRERPLRMTNFGPNISFRLKSGKLGTGQSYVSFRTRRPVSFQDFNQGNTCQITLGSAGFILGYSYIVVRVWDTTIWDPLLIKATMKGTSVMIGLGLREAVGNCFIDYFSGNGQPPQQANYEVVRWIKDTSKFETSERLEGPMRVPAMESKKIVLPADTLFNFGSATLTSQSAAALQKALVILNERSHTGAVWVEGHADSIGSESANLALSLRRAQAVVKWLKDHGVEDANKLIPVDFGERYPAAPNEIEGLDNPSGRAENRRVEISYKRRSL